MGLGSSRRFRDRRGPYGYGGYPSMGMDMGGLGVTRQKLAIFLRKNKNYLFRLALEACLQQ